jgi:hypothetical protein
MPNQPEGSVRDMLIAKVDELTGRMAELVEDVRAVTEQLEPEPGRAAMPSPWVR